MSTLGLILLFTFISGVLSMIGGVVLLWRQSWVKGFAIHFVSFAVGALLAGAFLDVLPEAIDLGGDKVHLIFWTVLIAIIAFFLIERLIYRVHTHNNPEFDPEHNHATPYMLLIGDGIHNFVDGVVVASAFLVNPSLGVVTAIAVAAHELPQEISDFSIMLHHGWSRSSVWWSNFGVSLTAFLGALITYSARNFLEPFLPFILAVSAGIFIYIASSDLLPEISPQTAKDKALHVFLMIALGVLTVWLAGIVGIGH